VTPRSPQAEELELPELDRADETNEIDVGVFELNIADEDQVTEEGPPDTFEMDIQVLPDAGGDEPAGDLDVGALDLLQDLPDERERDDDNATQEPSADDLDPHLEMPLDSDEPSAEAELGDNGLESLPELVRDTEGDEGPDVEGSLLPSAPEGDVAAGSPYEIDWLLLGDACSALWAEAGVVLAVAQHFMRFGAERQSLPLPAGLGVLSLCGLSGAGALLATTRGLFESQQGGGMVACDPPDSSRSSGTDVVEIAGSPSTPPWARLVNGSAYRRRNAAWVRHEAGGEVRAITSLGRDITLLVIARRPTLQLSSDGGGSFHEVLLPEPAATVAQGLNATAVAGGRSIALADPERGLCVSHDGGQSFRMVTGGVNVTAITLGEHHGKPVVFAALHREGADLSELIAVDPELGRAERIAELSGDSDEEAEETGRTTALRFADGSLWAAGGYGLAKLRG
jgi:hypothetical protein